MEDDPNPSPPCSVIVSPIDTPWLYWSVLKATALMRRGRMVCGQFADYPAFPGDAAALKR